MNVVFHAGVPLSFFYYWNTRFSEISFLPLSRPSICRLLVTSFFIFLYIQNVVVHTYHILLAAIFYLNTCKK